jgi:hypothetical protein
MQLHELDVKMERLVDRVIPTIKNASPKTKPSF